ncbi:MAG TPA: NHL repeat-containing protein, partial [Salinimicrobium sp.]|nr:NHL repeat-containing protein [Salinimicrobium sp.]
MILGQGSIVGQEVENIPTYEHLFGENIGEASPSDLRDLIISIDTDSEGNVYLLSFGNGIVKYDTGGNTSTIVSGSKLSSPLDLAIDDNDIIYVADSDSKLIKKFDTSGNLIGTIGSGNGGNGENEFWEPTGLAIDEENNLYIVDSYRGDNTEVTEKYFLKIYYADGRFKNFQGTAEHPLEDPYRVGVNSVGDIYISHAANNGEVVVFNKQLEYLYTLDNIGSPGSIVVDDFDFVHVIDYAERIDFNQLLNYENINDQDAGKIVFQVFIGIINKEFSIQIYDANGVHEKTFKGGSSEEERLHLPLDLAFNNCDRLYVNNSNINGSKLEFELEVYQRSPSFDTEKPVVQCIASGKEFFLVDGIVEITVDDIEVGSTDNCSIESKVLSEDTFTTVGEKTIRLTVTDKAGNSDFCETTIIIKEQEEEDSPPEAICKSFEVSLDENGLAAITAEMVYGGTEDLELSINVNSFDCSDLGENPVVLTVTDPDTGLSETCEATILVEDNMKPVYETCLGDAIQYGVKENGKFILPDYSSQVTIKDNCS